MGAGRSLHWSPGAKSLFRGHRDEVPLKLTTFLHDLKEYYFFKLSLKFGKVRYIHGERVSASAPTYNEMWGATVPLFTYFYGHCMLVDDDGKR